MITNFESITKVLNPEEIAVILPLIRVLYTASHENPMKANEIVSVINSNRDKIGSGVYFNEVKLRKMVNFIRSESILPVIATSRGYYVSYDSDDIASQVKSMEERADAILHARSGLMNFLKK
jgi:hypothetical protein